METIDSITHCYTGKQILSQCLRVWGSEGTDTPLVLLTEKGEAQWRIKAARVALSKERKKQNVSGYYGIATSDVFPWTHKSGYKGEAIIIRFDQKKWQLLSYTFATRVLGINSKGVTEAGAKQHDR